MANFPTTVKQLLAFPQIKYLEGLPRDYRFNAKTGTLFQGATVEITKKGQSFSFIPLSYRIFTAEMFNYEKKDWAEIFFINDRGHISCIMFHGYSVEQLRATIAGLFYEDRNLCQTVLTVSAAPKSNEHGAYYVAEFSTELIPEKELKDLESIHNSGVLLYQFKTLNFGGNGDVSMNYGLQISGKDELPELEEGKE